MHSHPTGPGSPKALGNSHRTPHLGVRTSCNDWGWGVGWGRGPAQDSASEDRHAGSKRKSRSFLEEEAEAKTAGS